MQNLDFYSGKIMRDIPPQFSREDPEYFAKINVKDEHKSMKRASRILSLIIALCIISFTSGLVVGIKFASGTNKQLVDQQTKEAVSGIGQKVSNLIKDAPETKANASSDEKKLFAKEDFPYIIKIGNQYNRTESQEIAGTISSHGHTVILSKDNGNYRIFVGPYRNQEDAFKAFKQVKTYSIKSNAVIVKR
ncbi:MAG: SPOR domain-containing protein [Spirochaetota bacterium]